MTRLLRTRLIRTCLIRTRLIRTCLIRTRLIRTRLIRTSVNTCFLLFPKRVRLNRVLLYFSSSPISKIQLVNYLVN